MRFVILKFTTFDVGNGDLDDNYPSRLAPAAAGRSSANSTLAGFRCYKKIIRMQIC